MRDRALARIKERGGNRVLNKTVVMRQIIDEIGELTTAPATDEWRAKLSAARIRFEQAERDHAEVAEAHRVIEEQAAEGLPRIDRPKATTTPSGTEGPFDFDAPLPDYDDEAI